MSPVLAVLLALPCVAWILMARTRRSRWIIGLALLAWIALAIGIGTVFPRARAEITIAYLPAAVAVIWIGRRLESRQLGQPDQATGKWAGKDPPDGDYCDHLRLWIFCVPGLQQRTVHAAT